MNELLSKSKLTSNFFPIATCTCTSKSQQMSGIHVLDRADTTFQCSTAYTMWETYASRFKYGFLAADIGILSIVRLT